MCDYLGNRNVWMNSFCTSVTHFGCHGRFLSSFLHNMLRLRELIKPTRFRGKCLLEPVGQNPLDSEGDIRLFGVRVVLN